MHFRIHGIQTPGSAPKRGDLISSVFEGQPIVGLVAGDVEGDLVIILSGSEEKPPVAVDLNSLEGPVAHIEGDVTIEPIDGLGFRAQTFEKPVGGCLILAPDGRRGLAVNYRQTISRMTLLTYDLETGEAWARTSGSIAVLGWRILVTPEGRREGFEVARFPA